MSEAIAVSERQQDNATRKASSSSSSSGDKHHHHCEECGLNFESSTSLEVHLRYHQEKFGGRSWLISNHSDESNNNNSKAGNHNSECNVIQQHSQQQQKNVSVVDSSSGIRPSNHSPASSASPGANSLSMVFQNPPLPSFNHHYCSPLYSDAGYYGTQTADQQYILPHYPPSESMPYHSRYHPYHHHQPPQQQQQQPHHFHHHEKMSPPAAQPTTLQCDKCGTICDNVHQLTEHVQSVHSSSSSSSGTSPYAIQMQLPPPPPPHYQQQHPTQSQSLNQVQECQQPPKQMHVMSPAHSQTAGQAQHSENYEFPVVQVKVEPKQEPVEQAEILDLDSHKVQTHRFEEELLRHQQQREQDTSLQHSSPQQMHDGTHPTSSVLNWPAATEQDYNSAIPSLAAPDSSSALNHNQYMHVPQIQDLAGQRNSPAISTTQAASDRQLPATGARQSQKQSPFCNQSWKSNEARRPKTYNCTACNKWFTSSGHLKRHYNTTLHKNAVKQSNQPDPANLPISAHHHPGRNSSLTRSTSNPQSPEISTSTSPPNLLAGPSDKAARGLHNTPVPVFSSSSSMVSDLMMTQQTASQNIQHLVTTSNPPMMQDIAFNPSNPGMVGIENTQHMQLTQMDSPPQSHLIMNSQFQDKSQQALKVSPSQKAIMVSAPVVMGGITMPIQAHPNVLPPHAIITSLPHQMNTISSNPTTFGSPDLDSNSSKTMVDKKSEEKVDSEILPSFGTLSSNQKQLPCFTQLSRFVINQHEYHIGSVGGLSPKKELTAPEKSYGISLDNKEIIREGKEGKEGVPLNYECLPPVLSISNCSTDQPLQTKEANNNIIKQISVKEKSSKMEAETELKLEEENKLFSTDSSVQYISCNGFHKCIKCNKIFNKACYLTQHNKSFHSGLPMKFKCSKCGKRFASEVLHADHLRKHAGDKPYKCEICPKQFNHKTDLRRHMCLHSGEKPFACDTCGKGFIRKDHMMKHLETHKRKAKNERIRIRA